ncbi:hypothetical protein HPP92_016916 [Vanilla planifolia]|uniref:Uncharacterized protein n=1 Tax=Vanilla planifolia TaxID=51239 RepID=A0A835USL4_VANPL|nr:hypothetical protein HPP92_016916 [Vanilla planifolia]
MEHVVVKSHGSRHSRAVLADELADLIPAEVPVPFSADAYRRGGAVGRTRIIAASRSAIVKGRLKPPPTTFQAERARVDAEYKRRTTFNTMK